MFFNKVETVGSVKDFLAESPTKKVITGSLVGLGVGVVSTILKPAPVAVPAMAMPILGTVNMTNTIVHAIDPLIQLVQGLSYPVGFIMICAGALVVMTGNRQKGMHMIKWAAIGYVLMQFAPGIMGILIEVGRAMSGH